MEYSPELIRKVFKSIKVHYLEPDYDAVRYSFGLKSTEDGYQHEPNKNLYIKLYNKFLNEEEIILFFASTFFHKNISWAGDLFNDMDHYLEMYRNAKKIMLAPDYHVISQLSYALSKRTFAEFCSNWLNAYRMTLNKSFDFETLCICNSAFSLLKLITWDETNPFATQLRYRLYKYNVFLSISGDMLKKIKLECKNVILKSDQILTGD